MKLARELSKRQTGRTLYLLDEPTTGLHFDDVRKLLEVLSRLVDQGNTVIVIEHNLDVVKTADWIVDLGPEGGEGGGTVVAEGTPEDVAAAAGSHTGEVLRPVLGPGAAVSSTRTRSAKPARRAARTAKTAKAPAATKAGTKAATKAGTATKAAPTATATASKGAKPAKAAKAAKRPASLSRAG